MHGVFGSEYPQCGADVIAPEWCEHVSAHCVRTCGLARHATINLKRKYVYLRLS